MAGRGQSAVYRIAERKRFVQIPNETARDFRLSLKATGLLTRLLSNADGWKIDSASLARQYREGRDAIQKATNELIEFGYVTRTKHQDRRGWFWTEYLVFDEPQERNGGDDAGAQPLPDMPDDPAAYDHASDVANMQVSPQPDFPAPDNPELEKPEPENRPHKDVEDEREKTKDDDERLTPPIRSSVDNYVDDELAEFPTVRQLADELAEASGRAIVWNLARPECIGVAAAISRFGDTQPLVNAALAQDEHQEQPAGTARAFVRTWTRLRAAPVRPRTAPAEAPAGPPARKPWCGECDELTRMREDTEGHPSHCPSCHPRALARSRI